MNEQHFILSCNSGFPGWERSRIKSCQTPAREIVMLIQLMLILINPVFAGEQVIPKNHSTTRIELNSNYAFSCRTKKSFDDLITLGACRIEFNSMLVAIFDSLSEFQEKNGFPKIVSKSKYSVILLYLNNRPNNDVIISIKVNNRKILKIDTMPSFPMKPFALDSTKNRYVGWLIDSYETAGSDSHLQMPYDPILIYSIDSGEYVFSREKTEMVNRNIYGKYYGKKYREDLRFPLNTTEPKINRFLDSIDCNKTKKIE